MNFGRLPFFTVRVILFFIVSEFSFASDCPYFADPSKVIELKVAVGAINPPTTEERIEIYNRKISEMEEELKGKKPSDRKMTAKEKKGCKDDLAKYKNDVANLVRQNQTAKSNSSNSYSSNQQKESRYVCQFTCLGSAWKRGGTYTLETYAAGSYEANRNLESKASDICHEEHRTTGSGTTFASFEPCNAK